MLNKYHNKDLFLNNNNDLNKTFENKKKKIKLNDYQFSSGKEVKKNRMNNPVKLTSLVKEEHKKSRPQNLTKKDYIICKQNKKFFKKNKTSLNNEYNNIEEIEQNNKNLINLIDNSNEEYINIRNISKDKTVGYSANNTFNNTNAYSNTNPNNTANNNYIIENNNSNLIKINDGELNDTSNSDKLKNPNTNIIAVANIKNINNFINTNNNNNDNINNNISKNSSDNKYICEYYSLKNKINKNKKRRENLLMDSRNFYLYCSERGILSKLKQLQSKSIEKELKENGLYFNDKKLNLYSDLRRLPTKVCFRKGNSTSKDDREDLEIYYKYNNDKFIKKLINKKYKGEVEKKLDNYHKLITKGFPKQKITINNKGEIENDIILDNKLIINSEKMKKKSKTKFVIDKGLYPLLTQKKILKNILPKEVDYNTQFTIMDIINDEMHPLNRFQKKNLTFHSNLISQEIELLFGKNIRLANLHTNSNIYQNTENLIQYKTGEKYNNLLKTLMKTEKKEKVIGPDLIEDKKKKMLRRKYLLEKFCFTLKKCMFKFIRLNITKDFFWQILFNENEINYKDGLYLFNAIKDGDINAIEKEVKKNCRLALFKDEFKQTPLHICAKRNIYQVVQLLVSRFADVNAQDVYGRTPLMCAAQCGNMEFVATILFAFADPNIEDKYGKKAVDYATDYKIKYALNISRIIHIFNNMMNSAKHFDEFVFRGLKNLFGKELAINYEPWLEINDKILNNLDDYK